MSGSDWEQGGGQGGGGESGAVPEHPEGVPGVGQQVVQGHVSGG